MPVEVQLSTSTIHTKTYTTLIISNTLLQTVVARKHKLTKNPFQISYLFLSESRSNIVQIPFTVKLRNPRYTYIYIYIIQTATKKEKVNSK